MKIKSLILSALITIFYSGCATESSKSLKIPKTTSSQKFYRGEKATISVGKFDNRSSYMRGIFSDGVDKLGGQSKTILISHLQQTGRFSVLDRGNLEEIKQEAVYENKELSIKGANYIIAGDVTEFGRKEIGDHQLFGILGKGKSQKAYAKVALNVINVKNSEVIFSSQGAGEYTLSSREIIGFGGRAGYDSTLNGKVLDLAIREAVDNLILGISNGAWNPLAN